MADVFLSYSSKDRAAAQRVQETLSRRGIDVFWDQETPPGQDWDTWTRSKLAEARVAVVLWSMSSVASDSVRHEALLARKAGKLLPALIDTLTPEDLPMGLYMVQSVKLTDWASADSKGMARLIAEIEALLGRRASPARGARAAKPSAKRKASGGVLLLGLIAVAAVAAGAWWMTRPQGAGAVTGADGASAATASSSTLSQRMAGRWNRDGIACKDGQNITMEGGKLVFTTPDTRFVHQIKSDTDKETHTRVLEPDYVVDEEYVLTPEYNATSEARSFNLVVENKTAKTRETWAPCEL